MPASFDKTTLPDAPAADDRQGGSASAHAQQPRRPGRIITLRHGRPNLDHSEGPKLTGREHGEWWARYEDAPLLPGQRPKAELITLTDDAAFLFSSSRPRSYQTAQLLAGERNIRVDAVFVEGALPALPLPDFVRFLPRIWNIMARISWMCGYAGDVESQGAARSRAGHGATILIDAAADGRDVVLVAHGWINRMLHRQFLARGWVYLARQSGPLISGRNAFWGHRIYQHPKL